MKHVKKPVLEGQKVALLFISIIGAGESLSLVGIEMSGPTTRASGIRLICEETTEKFDVHYFSSFPTLTKRKEP